MHIELGNENIPTTCECCGNKTKTVWGYAYKNEVTLAAYFVQWTHAKPDHAPNFDFLIGTWGNNEINDKVLASWVYNTNNEGGSFMVIDSYNRPTATSELCSKALTRNEVINNSELMGICAEILDSVWLHDPRIIEITNFGKSA